jgi:site-specific DNA recombinase
MPNAIIYARFSPRPDEEQAESLEYQLPACRRRAEQLGLTVKAEFGDAAASGADIERAGLWEAIAAIEPGDVLIVHKLDRLARGDAVLPVVLEEIIQSRGGRIDSCLNEGTWGDRDDESNWLMRRIVQVFNEYFRRVTVGRTRVAMRRYQSNGRLMSSTAIFGKQIDPNDPSRMIDEPDEQAAIERVVREWKSGHTSLRGIARQLTEEGKLYRGHPWHPQGVKRILQASGILPPAPPRKRQIKRLETQAAKDIMAASPQLELVRAKARRSRKK